MRNFEAKDYAQIEEWFKRRNLVPVGYGFLPKKGLIEDGVAAGFLIQTEIPIAIIDFFISNPLASSRERAVSLNEIAEGLINTARGLKMKAIKCDTKYENIRAMALFHGFSHYGEASVFVKEL